ncbi:hypothetical protein ACQBAR_09950 [Propionibacteriaceae bacterium Y1685]|uniref:hypothetical protein n=1 Tax=Microlunatus sp. Y1700 TaxID=3418487 RepID=UPI003B7EF1C8
MPTHFHGLRRTGTTMALIGGAAMVLLVAVIIIRLVRGVFEPALLWWLVPLALWAGLTGVALTNTLTRSSPMTTVTTFGRTVRTIRDEKVVSVRMNGRRFEVSAGGREVCSVLTGYGVELNDVVESYRELLLADPQLVKDDRLLRQWVWHQGQRPDQRGIDQ